METLSKEEAIMEQNFESEIIKIGSTIIPENEVVKECVVGEGGFGKVYKGKYQNQTVAIKKIKLEEKEPEIFESLLNEIKVIMKANNPEIPKFLGLMKKKGKYHLIFEFITGKSLKELYPQLSYKDKLIVLYDLCGILESFHAKNLIHRDIKPGNLMIEDGLKVRLIDFGVSKIASHTSTFTKAQIGTVPYMSPEQFQIDLDRFSDPNIDDVKPVPISTKSDIWSLGVMISEIFSGIKPYFNLSKKRSPTEQMITGRLTGNKPFPIPNNLDDDIKEVVKRATEVNPEKRATASEIKTMIKALMDKKNNETETKIDSNKESESKTIVTQPETKNI